MDAPFISIVVPVYNAAEYLSAEKCLLKALLAPVYLPYKWLREKISLHIPYKNGRILYISVDSRSVAAYHTRHGNSHLPRHH